MVEMAKKSSLIWLDFPTNLLSNIQGLLVVFFWDVSLDSSEHHPSAQGGRRAGPRDLLWRAHSWRSKAGQVFFFFKWNLKCWTFLDYFLKYWTFLKKKKKSCGTLHWLLRLWCRWEHGHHWTVPPLSRPLISSGIETHWVLVNISGIDQSRAEDLAACMGLWSLCILN